MLKHSRCFAVITVAVAVAVTPKPGNAQSQDIAAIVAQFYPQKLVDASSTDPESPVVRKQCFAVLEQGPSDRAQSILAAYTDSFLRESGYDHRSHCDASGRE